MSKQDELAALLSRANAAQRAQTAPAPKTPARKVEKAESSKRRPKAVAKTKAVPKAKAVGRVERPAAEPTSPKPPSKKLSKRQDPDWQPVTLFLTLETSDAMDDAIRDAKRSGAPIGDRSDLADLAIRDWLARRARK